MSIVYSACIPWAKTFEAKKKSENEAKEKKNDRTKLAATVKWHVRVCIEDVKRLERNCCFFFFFEEAPSYMKAEDGESFTSPWSCRRPTTCLLVQVLASQVLGAGSIASPSALASSAATVLPMSLFLESGSALGVVSSLVTEPPRTALGRNQPPRSH